jgi:biotin operon repressor
MRSETGVAASTVSWLSSEKIGAQLGVPDVSRQHLARVAQNLLEIGHNVQA